MEINKVQWPLALASLCISKRGRKPIHQVSYVVPPFTLLDIYILHHAGKGQLELECLYS